MTLEEAEFIMACEGVSYTLVPTPEAKEVKAIKDEISAVLFPISEISIRFTAADPRLVSGLYPRINPDRILLETTDGIHLSFTPKNP